MTQVQQLDKLAEVVKVLVAGKAFYQHLLSQVSDQEIQAVIGKMVNEHMLAIRELQSFMTPSKSENEDALVQMIVKTYKQLTDVISFECLHIYADQLEELENKTLKVIDQAISMPQSQVYKQYLQRVRVSIQDCHDQIKLL